MWKKKLMLPLLIVLMLLCAFPAAVSAATKSLPQQQLVVLQTWTYSSFQKYAKSWSIDNTAVASITRKSKYSVTIRAKKTGTTYLRITATDNTKYVKKLVVKENSMIFSLPSWSSLESKGYAYAWCLRKLNYRPNGNLEMYLRFYNLTDYAHTFPKVNIHFWLIKDRYILVVGEKKINLTVAANSSKPIRIIMKKGEQFVNTPILKKYSGSNTSFEMKIMY